MHQFLDSKNRTWHVALTIGAVKRVRAALGIDLLRPQDPIAAAGEPADGKAPPLVTALHLDLVLLIDAIFVVCQPQAVSAQIDADEFAAGLAGDAAQRAYVAFVEEWADFFRQLGRADAAKAIAAHRRLVETQIAAAEILIDQAEGVARKRAEEAIAATAQKIAGPSTTSTRLPASPAAATQNT